MKKLSSDEFDALPLHGKGSSSPLYNKLLNLQVGEALIILKTEWYVKYSPTTTMNRIERTRGYQFQRGALADRSGWAVKRVK